MQPWYMARRSARCLKVLQQEKRSVGIAASQLLNHHRRYATGARQPDMRIGAGDGGLKLAAAARLQQVLFQRCSRLKAARLLAVPTQAIPTGSEEGMTGHPSHTSSPAMPRGSRLVSDFYSFPPPLPAVSCTELILGRQFFQLIVYHEKDKLHMVHAVQSLLEREGCVAPIVSLARLREAPYANTVFEEILSALGQQRDNIEISSQLFYLMFERGTPFHGLILKDADNIQYLDDNERKILWVFLRALRETGNVGCMLVGTPHLPSVVLEIQELPNVFLTVHAVHLHPADCGCTTAQYNDRRTHCSTT